MLDVLSTIPNLHAAWNDIVNTAWWTLSIKWAISVFALMSLFFVLVTEKIDKNIVSILIAILLVFMQVFTWADTWTSSSQEIASIFIYKNLDIFGFIIGMMIITWIVKDSWIFNFIAIKIAQKIKWNPKKLFFIFSYMAFFMTVFISNIPTIIILAPIIVLITHKLKIPTLPYIIWIITFANLGWAVTPISDPTTYYQSSILGFKFFDVVFNTGLIMFISTITSSLYLYLVFRHDLNKKPETFLINRINAKKYLKNKNEIIISLFILVWVIFFILLKEYIFNITWVRFDNWSIALFGGFLSILLLKDDVSTILKKKIDYATLFFFAGLFIVIWALEYNWVIIILANKLLEFTGWSESWLLLMFTMWSALLSVFIDNVPYNIAMVSTLQQFTESWVVTWVAWTALAWWLNSCTSIGWAGSPIWAACNVIALWQAEKKWVIVHFFKYLMIWVPLVLVNSFIAYLILYFRYLI